MTTITRGSGKDAGATGRCLVAFCRQALLFALLVVCFAHLIRQVKLLYEPHHHHPTTAATTTTATATATSSSTTASSTGSGAVASASSSDGTTTKSDEAGEKSDAATTATTEKQPDAPLASSSSSIASNSNTNADASGSGVEGVARALHKMGLEPLYNGTTVKGDPWKATTYQRLDRIRVICGDLCRMNDLDSLWSHRKTVETSHLPMIQVPNVDCEAILASDDIDVSDPTVPDYPAELIPYYTFGIAEPSTFIIQKNKYGPVGKRSDVFVAGKPNRAWITGNLWKEADIDAAVQAAGRRQLNGPYGRNVTNQALDGLADVGNLQGKSALVIGSLHPWVEAILLHYGAAKVTTLEYHVITSEHPKIATLTLPTFRRKYLAGELEKFDVIVSWSSLEHSGLGRYGDAANPWADILAATRAWCVTKPGGYMYLGLPVGRDSIYSNWHRVYGELRWPLIAANWKPLSKTDGRELFYEPSHNPKHAGYLFQKPQQ